MHSRRTHPHNPLALHALLFVLAWAAPAGADGKKATGAEPLPWASDPTETSQGGLVVRAKDQLVGYYRRDMTGFRFEVENITDGPLTFRATGLEALWAWSAWPPPGPGESTDRAPRTRKLVIRGCWYEDAAHKITEVRKGGSGPVSFSVPPKTRLRVMLRFESVRRRGGHTYWRRLTYSAGGPPQQVTGPIVPIRFSEGSIQGELR